VILADGASGRVLSTQGEVWEGFASGGKQRLFGGRVLGGVTRLGDNLFAIARPGENHVAVMDNKGTPRFVQGEGGSDEGRLYVVDRGNQRVSKDAKKIKKMPRMKCGPSTERRTSGAQVVHSLGVLGG
jgi:hypothetical protein